jgi:hypothetical protein
MSDKMEKLKEHVMANWQKNIKEETEVIHVHVLTPFTPTDLSRGDIYEARGSGIPWKCLGNTSDKKVYHIGHLSGLDKFIYPPSSRDMLWGYNPWIRDDIAYEDMYKKGPSSYAWKAGYSIVDNNKKRKLALKMFSLWKYFLKTNPKTWFVYYSTTGKGYNDSVVWKYEQCDDVENFIKEISIDDHNDSFALFVFNND